MNSGIKGALLRLKGVFVNSGETPEDGRREGDSLMWDHEREQRTLPGFLNVEVRGPISSRFDVFLGSLGILIVVGLWIVLTHWDLVTPLFLPSPRGIIESIVEFQRRNWLWPAIFHSVLRVMISLSLVIAIGVPIGVLMGAFTPIDALFRKIINGAKSVPTTGLVGLIVLWFSIEEKAKIIFLFLGAIFYMIILVKNAIASVNDDYQRVALDLGANRWQVIRYVLLPGALPQIWDAIAVCSGIMWTYILLAEFINSNEEQLGLGYLLYIGSRTQGSGKVFATLIIIATISSVTDALLHFVRRRWLNW